MITIKDEKIKLPFMGWLIITFLIVISFLDSIIMNYNLYKMHKKAFQGYSLEEGIVASSYNIGRRSNRQYKIDIKYKDSAGITHIATMTQRWNDRVGEKINFYVQDDDKETAWWNKISVARFDYENFLALLLPFAVLVSQITGKRIVIEDKIVINNKKTISAEVILVDNLHTPKKLICQEKRADGTVVQYKKEKEWGNFKEKPGEYVAVDVNAKNERQYEIFER